MLTDVIAVPGERTSGTQAADFVVAGPGWKGTLPEGISHIPSLTF